MISPWWLSITGTGPTGDICPCLGTILMSQLMQGHWVESGVQNQLRRATQGTARAPVLKTPDALGKETSPEWGSSSTRQEITALGLYCRLWGNNFATGIVSAGLFGVCPTQTDLFCIPNTLPPLHTATAGLLRAAQLVRGTQEGMHHCISLGVQVLRMSASAAKLGRDKRPAIGS